ncbi:electron transfer flavoprotein subunit beta/FixA family protein [Kosmotoga sp. DU53]|uniref:electron transfer flavoprotein subunit beta/FixA family protein n=1 Tax=Kosmotoga sp. DU53 TaxID=1310160 RepID=UPI0007C5BB47|nr:electron transfer flavoprotein subunit beta/FixA family protein [Kosmotoga sp. DU53]MDK2954364.1 hypothetical protein [Kosmotoga sp.]OAA23450.1 electron transfer flavoprotein subunit beta [Kosmotoga sp. DU53]
MEIIVCIKQVPDTTELKIDPITGTLIRKGVPSIMNYDDKAALEEALKLKDSYNAKVTVITMGPEQAREVLEEALAMGADQAILLSDKRFSGADTWATSSTLAAAIKKLSFDVIFTGRQAIDGDTAQVGPQLAEKLNIPQVTYVRKVKFDGREFIVEREIEDGFEIVKVNPPVLFTVVKQANKPRYMSIRKIVEVCSEDKITTWKYEDIEIDENHIGLKGSPTKVKRTFIPEPKGRGKILQGSLEEQLTTLINELKEKHLL